MLDADAPVNETCAPFTFPLHYAARLPDPAMLALLLDAGANVHLVDASGTSALHNAAEHGRAECAALLLRHGARVDGSAAPDRGQPLHAAAAQEVAKVLLDAGADLEAREGFGYTPLMSLVRHAEPATIALLLARGASPWMVDDYGTTVLHEAGSAAVATMLLDLVGDGQVDVSDDDGVTPLVCAVQLGKADVAEVYLARGADVTTRLPRTTESLLHFAARSGDARLVACLLAHGADPRATDGGGALPVHVAGSAKVVDLLVTAGGVGMMGLRTADGETPLHRGAEAGAEVVAALLAHGADPDAVDDRGRGPVDRATGLPGTVATLLAASGATGSLDDLRDGVLEHAVADPEFFGDVRAVLAAGAAPAPAVRTAARRGDPALRELLVWAGVPRSDFELDPVPFAAAPQRELVVHQGRREAISLLADEPILVRWSLEGSPDARPVPVAACAIGELHRDGRAVHRRLAVGGDVLAAVGGDRVELRQWDRLAEVRFARPGADQLADVSFSADGDRLAVSAVSAGPFVLDTTTGRTLADVGELGAGLGLDDGALAGAWPGAAAFVTDGSRLVGLADDAGWWSVAGVRLDPAAELAYHVSDGELGFLGRQMLVLDRFCVAPDDTAALAWLHDHNAPERGVLVALDPVAGELRWTRHLEVPGYGGVAGVCVSGDGRWVVVAVGERVHWLSVTDGAVRLVRSADPRITALAWDEACGQPLAATSSGLRHVGVPPAE